MEIYVKGAPEVMVDICDRDSCVLYNTTISSHELIFLAVPQDYEDLLSYYTKRGYRVIAMAGKSIEGLSWLKAQRMKRYENATSFSAYSLMLEQRTSRIGVDFPWINHLRK